MFNFLKNKKKISEESGEHHHKPSFTSRLKAGLKRTRQNLNNGLANIFLGKKNIDDELLEQLESTLIMADVGVPTTQKILDQLTQLISRKDVKDAETLQIQLKNIITQILEPVSKPLIINHHPTVILMVGVNGAGKTTSIAKLAHFYQQQGHSIMLGAGDTFRAAAIEQLQTWGERNDVPVIAQHSGADSASVIYDALQATYARKLDVLIADTAGRLHTQAHLMEELKKIKRVMQKQHADVPHETMLVLDASIGQNGLVQAKQFHDAIGLTGITITKLDGTARGGILLAIADQLQLPIRFIGIGEDIDDLQPFNALEFTEALFSRGQDV